VDGGASSSASLLAGASTNDPYELEDSTGSFRVALMIRFFNSWRTWLEGRLYGGGASGVDELQLAAPGGAPCAPLCEWTAAEFEGIGFVWEM
jgi:hypothetical protein